MHAKRALLVFAAAASVCYPTFTAFAQVVPPDAGSRGVRILRPEETAPAKTEAPPAVTPAPAPAPPPPKAAPPRPAPPPVAPVVKLCPRPDATPDLKVTAANFDRTLSRALTTKKAVTVDLDKPYPQDGEAPAPIARWLAEVKSGGGEVTVSPYCGRGFLSDVVAKVTGFFRPTPVYQPARAYNVILHADALDKVVTQVEFKPKTAQ